MKTKSLVKIKPENGKLRVEVWLFEPRAITCYIIEGILFRTLTRPRVVH